MQLRGLPLALACPGIIFIRFTAIIGDSEAETLLGVFALDFGEERPVVGFDSHRDANKSIDKSVSVRIVGTDFVLFAAFEIRSRLVKPFSRGGIIRRIESSKASVRAAVLAKELGLDLFGVVIDLNVNVVANNIAAWSRCARARTTPSRATAAADCKGMRLGRRKRATGKFDCVVWFLECVGSITIRAANSVTVTVVDFKCVISVRETNFVAKVSELCAVGPFASDNRATGIFDLPSGFTGVFLWK